MNNLIITGKLVKVNPIENIENGSMLREKESSAPVREDPSPFPHSALKRSKFNLFLSISNQLILDFSYSFRMFGQVVP